MSKNQPEMNDIYTDGTHLIRVDEETGDQFIRYYCYVLYENKYAEIEIISLEKLQEYTYLGKAKHNIEILFKTENEE